jgi:hypothetical protein
MKSIYIKYEKCWLINYATSRKVAGSSPDKVITIFSLPSPSNRAMALEFTELLREMSIRIY